MKHCYGVFHKYQKILVFGCRITKTFWVRVVSGRLPELPPSLILLLQGQHLLLQAPEGKDGEAQCHLLGRVGSHSWVVGGRGQSQRQRRRQTSWRHSKDDGFDQMADARPSKSALQVGEESGLDAGQKTFLFLTITLFHLWCVHLDSGVCLAGSMQYIKNLLDCNGANLGGLPQNEGRKNPLYKDKTFLLIGKSNAKLAKIQ